MNSGILIGANFRIYREVLLLASLRMAPVAMPACFSDAANLIDVIRLERQRKHPFAIRLERIGGGRTRPGAESPRPRSLPRRAHPNASP